MRVGVAPKKSERVVDVAQGAECGVHGGLLEDRARVEDACELCGGQTPGVERELLDTAQALERGRGCGSWTCKTAPDLAMPVGDGSC